MKIGALGGPQTFGDQACRLLMERYPEYDQIVYVPTAEELFEAVERGDVHWGVAPEQMSQTGFHQRQQAYIAAPGSRLYIDAEITHEYHCCLVGKPGSSIEGVRKVIGHTGSMTQSRRWLEANLGRAEIEIVHTNSRAAALVVLEGDGSVASVATPALAEELRMPVLAGEIDGGSVGNYWAYTGTPHFDATPTRLVVAGRFDDERQQGQVTALTVALARAGYTIQTVCTQPTGQRLFEFDYVMRLRGTGRLDDVQAALATFPTARLAGAFTPR
jgi:prephenate dehydratase